MSDDVLPPQWISVRLHEIVSKLVDGSHNPPEKKPDGLPMLSAINIADNQITFSTYRLIDAKFFAAEDRRTSIKPGDVLLTIVGAIGRAAVVPPQCTKFTLQRSVAVLSPVIIDPKFLMHQLESPRLSQHLKDNARGTAQKGVISRHWVTPRFGCRRLPSNTASSPKSKSCSPNSTRASRV